MTKLVALLFCSFLCASALRCWRGVSSFGLEEEAEMTPLSVVTCDPEEAFCTYSVQNLTVDGVLTNVWFSTDCTKHGPPTDEACSSSIAEKLSERICYCTQDLCFGHDLLQRFLSWNPFR